jgi:Domain of unknown function (DUF4440)
VNDLDTVVGRWIDAERRGDAAALDDLLDGDFRGIGPLGFVVDKQQWLDRYRSGDLNNSAFAWQDTQQRVFGDAAVITGVQVQTTTYQGRDASGQFRGALVAVRRDGQWSIVNVQLSMLGSPPGR